MQFSQLIKQFSSPARFWVKTVYQKVCTLFCDNDRGAGSFMMWRGQELQKSKRYQSLLLKQIGNRRLANDEARL